MNKKSLLKQLRQDFASSGGKARAKSISSERMKEIAMRGGLKFKENCEKRKALKASM